MLNTEQTAALAKIQTWLATPGSAPFLLRGSAGTGKTFLISQLVETAKARFVFTAPTNKATKVLRDSMTSDTLKPDCRTIYSLLGLRLEASGEVKELKAPDDPIDLSRYKAVIVDESSMLNSSLLKHIKKSSKDFGVKFLFLGDGYQLPPVGESFSQALFAANYSAENQAELLTVMRHDNQILTLATKLRSEVDKALPKFVAVNDNFESQGVYALGGQDFQMKFVEAAQAGLLQKPGSHKMIAWRNTTVDRYNQLARRAIFSQPRPWEITDRVLFTGPGKDVEGKPMASTDDEGEITKVLEDWHHEFRDIKTLRISITLDDNKLVNAVLPHPDFVSVVSAKLQKLSEEAHGDGKRWKTFWAFKEAFHELRHAYAITAHRSQGSTYSTAFVDWRDILLNRNRTEAFKCLYVAATRPKQQLYLN